MEAIIVNNLILGDNVPKICVPIVSTTKYEILKDVERANKTDHDLIELRIDHFENSFDINSIINLLKEIREIYFKSIIFTFRTKKEGGLKDIDEESYFDLNSQIAKSKLVDFIDIEFFNSEEKILKFIEEAHLNNIHVILSSHEYSITLDKEDLLNRIKKMQLLGADITKLAVMPITDTDVLDILSISLDMKSIYANKPFIVLAMGSLGTITRVAAELFGSCITYASLSNNVSAPGQLSVENTRLILNNLKLNME